MESSTIIDVNRTLSVRYFPAEVSTNTCVLVCDIPCSMIWLLTVAQEGSSDIAYAKYVVSTTSRPGLPDTEKTQSESSQCNSLERLRSAENELRKARILVALDRPRAELFTFYRKEDLQRDAKSISNRVMAILRKNECQMSWKDAIKTTYLLRADHGKLHRLFVYAILSMIKSETKQNENLIGLDINTYLYRVPLSFSQPDGPLYNSENIWKPLNLDVQLLSNGQVIAVYSHDSVTKFRRVTNTVTTEGFEPGLVKPSKILLALTGQYARYAGGYFGKLPRPVDTAAAGANSSDHNKEEVLERYKQQVWKESVGGWLAEYEFDFLVEDETWIELELPLCQADTEHPITPDGIPQRGKIIWKPVFWPTSLCFVSTVDQLLTEQSAFSTPCFEDPLRFVEDWIASANDREDAVREMEQIAEVKQKPGRAEEPDTSHSNNIHIDAGQSFRRVTSLDGQMATIYPTPPDGMLSQVTPGVISADGLGATPGDSTHVVQSHRAGENVERIDLVREQAAIGSGLYDEDLFEDVPGEKFGEGEMADEPNWDFFDEPDVDMMADEDPMELDVPEKAASAAVENQVVNHSKIEQANSQVALVLSDCNNGMRLDEKGITHDPEFTTLEEGRPPRIVDDGPKGHGKFAIRSADLNSQPLSPSEVRKKLFVDMASPNSCPVKGINAVHSNRRSLLKSHFEWSTFQPDLKTADSRYSANGSFWFEPKQAGEHLPTNIYEQHLNMPMIGIPKKDRNILISGSPRNSEPPHSSSSVEDTDFDSSDFFSESNRCGSPSRSTGGEVVSLPTSPEPAEETLNPDTRSRIRDEVMALMELLHPEINERPFGLNHQPLQRALQPTLPVSHDRLLTIAQVIVDQVSQSFFNHDCPDHSSTAFKEKSLAIFPQLQSIYGDAMELDVAKLAGMATATHDVVEGNGLKVSPSPFIRLARADVSMNALSTIQPFWETLGLQPLNGKKDVTALCIHPAGLHIQEGSSALLQRLGETYTNCNLGSHTIANIQDATDNGLVEWDAKEGSGVLELLKTCEQVGTSLTTLAPVADNVIIYIVNPFRNKSALADVCNAFVALFTKYASACRKCKPNELNLQIIPMSFIASPDTVVIPSQPEYLSLALEVYNRCPLTTCSHAVADSAAAVTLAEPGPKNIMFSLTPDAASPLSKHGDTLHLAYSKSVDLRWLTACWTDTLGKTALTMTYCMSQKGSTVSRPRSEIILEMLETSEDIMINTRGQWRLFVAHDGPIEPDEINEWSAAANQNASSKQIAHCVLTLLTFDKRPSIQFSSSTPQNKSQPPFTATMTTTGKYGTPVSTPSALAMTSSPEQSTVSTPFPPTPGPSSGLITAPTPPDQSGQPTGHGFSFDTGVDPDTTLHDPTDECWSLVLNFGLNYSISPLESRPAQLSGFLLKRCGPLDSDGLVALGVNLIYSSSSAAAGVETNKAEQKSLLSDVIDQWRCLYTLARTKSLVQGGAEGTVLPWHVRTAVVGCKAVSEML